VRCAAKQKKHRLPPGIFTVQTKGDKTISANGGRDWRAAWHQA
jgi:hypothetical protein